MTILVKDLFEALNSTFGTTKDQYKELVKRYNKSVNTNTPFYAPVNSNDDIYMSRFNERNFNGVKTPIIGTVDFCETLYVFEIGKFQFFVVQERGTYELKIWGFISDNQF